MSVKSEALARVPLFEGLSDAELASIAAGAREVHYDAGAELIRQGDAGTEFFVVLAGALEIFVSGRLVNRLGAGDFLGELALLFGAPRSASAITTEPTELLVMDRATFDALMAEAPSVEAKVLGVVAARLRYR